MTRYVVLGAGAIGGVIGGRMHDAGHDVVLIARGENLAALQSGGLRLFTPAGEETHAVPAAGSVGEAGLGNDDVIIMAVKSQQTSTALQGLSMCALDDIPVVCAQNGVANERAALRHFRRVYGMCVVLPAEHTSPGTVVQQSYPVPGVLDLGCYPHGSDSRAEAIAADLVKAGFHSVVETAVMRLKYRKLLLNVHNALDALCGEGGRGSALADRAREEGRACFEAAGIDVQPVSAEVVRREAAITIPASHRRGGSSSWQSLARHEGSIEADWLNGEIVLLGRLHGVPTPVNELLQSLANRAAREEWGPGSMSLDEVLAQAP